MGRSLLILVDTHIVVWMAFEEARLSKKATAAITEARLDGQGLAISDISLFELARALSRERTHLNITVESPFERLGFHGLIRKIRQIESSGRPLWSKTCRWSRLTAASRILV